jgi:hypothetical protein
MQPIDDRRSEPRFHVAGRVEIDHDGNKREAEVLDLSLNGALLTTSPSPPLPRGARVRVGIWIGGACHFDADAEVAHVQADRLGIEFTGMSTRDFDVFSGLILLLSRQRQPETSSAEAAPAPAD